MTVAWSGHPCTFPWTADPVITNPTFQFLFRPASASVVHEFDATIFMVELPDEKSVGTVAGAVTLLQVDSSNIIGMDTFLTPFVPEEPGRQYQLVYSKGRT